MQESCENHVQHQNRANQQLVSSPQHRWEDTTIKKKTVLSPGAVEGANQSHFKTLFQDLSPSQVRMSMKGLKQVPFETPNIKQSNHMVRIIAYGANPVHFRTIIHNRNDKMSSFQDPKQHLLKRNK